MSSTKKILIVILAAGGFAVAGCSSMGSGPSSGSAGAISQPLAVSSRIPSAQGQVTVSQTKSNNTAIDLTIKHMAPPHKLNPDKNTYVVWQQPVGQQNAQPQNLGAIAVDQNESGSLQTVTPMRNFQLFVTAESDVAATQPTGQKLLWTQINR